MKMMMTRLMSRNASDNKDSFDCDNKHDEYIEDLKKSIRYQIVRFIAGSIIFIVLSLAFIGLGFVLIFYPSVDLPHGFFAFSIGGFVLLWEMFKLSVAKFSLPDRYVLLEACDCPVLFTIINEITGSLGLSRLDHVYLSPDASAAVIVIPRIRNLVSMTGERQLVIGLGFLSQMDDQEIRAVLYHEFGHYVQKNTDGSASVYAVGQIARLLVKTVDDGKTNVWNINMKNMKLLFSYFVMSVCRNIKTKFTALSRQMEYEADDLAVRYVGKDDLQRALLHAACIRYNTGMVDWGLKKLSRSGYGLDDYYSALGYVCRFSVPGKSFLKREVIRRVERLGELSVPSNMPVTWTVRDSIRCDKIKAMLSPFRCETGMNILDAQKFALWMSGGITLYQRHLLSMKSVSLTVHLDRKKHRIPFIEGIYDILIDGKPIGTGNFIKGYDIRHRISSGRHVMTVYVPGGIGIGFDSFQFETTGGESYMIDMDYRYDFKKTRYHIFVSKFIEV